MADTPSEPHIPGEPGLWVMIFGDLLVFSLFFVTFATYRMADAALFAQSQARLNQASGLVNTLLLLTSSFAIAVAVNRLRSGEAVRARSAANAGLLFGAAFVVVKLLEYREKFLAGLYPTTNDFFMFYFAFTGIHLLHVLVGLAALAFVRHACGAPLTPGRFRAVEACAVFWHLVDVLWVILFAILYLHN
ncbi:MAG: hypothetical protein RIS94_3411 [Pseudomonadota bacterium]